MKTSVPLFTALACLSLQNVSGQSVTFQLLYPTGDSRVNAITASQQAGYAGSGAALWSGPTASYLDLNPFSRSWSSITGISGNQQVGYVYSAGQTMAGLWNGTAASFVNLNPPGAYSSAANDASAGQQAGVASFGEQRRPHAGYWSGRAASWVDLHPTGALESVALCTTGTQQAGEVGYQGLGPRAALWSGTAESMVVLHPSGGAPYDGTTVLDLTLDYQVGRMVRDGENPMAVVWFGSAESMISMNPPGASGSTIFAAYGDYQAGYAAIGTQFHAGIWNKSANSFFDLHGYVSSSFEGSQAFSIYIQDGTIYVGGSAYRYGTEYAAMWTIVPEPAVTELLALAFLCACARRRAPRQQVGVAGQRHGIAARVCAGSMKPGRAGNPNPEA